MDEGNGKHTQNIPSQSLFTLQALPEETLRIIITHLNGSTVAKLARLSQYFYTVISNDLTWKQVIQQELTNQPQLIDGESYYHFYKRHYLGIQKTMNSGGIDSSETCKQNIHEQHDDDSHAKKHYYQPRTSWVYIDQFHPYKQYELIENDLPSRNCNYYYFKFFFLNAARNNLEVWANKLYQQISRYLQQQQVENIYLQSLYVATRENSCHFIRQFLYMYIQYHDNECPPLFATLAKNHTPIVWKIFYCISLDSHLISALSEFFNLLPLYQAVINKDLNNIQFLLHCNHDLTHLWSSVSFCIIYYISLCGNISTIEYVLSNYQNFFEKQEANNSHGQTGSCNTTDFESKWEREMIRAAVDRNGCEFLKILRKMSTIHFIFKHYYSIALWHAIYRTLVNPTSYPNFWQYITLECNDLNTFTVVRKSNRDDKRGVELIFRACYKLMEDYDSWKEKDEIVYALTGLVNDNCPQTNTYDLWATVFQQLLPDLAELDNPLCREYDDYYFCHDIYNLITLIKDKQITPPELFRKLRIIESKNEISKCLSLYYSLNKLHHEQSIADWIRGTSGYRFEELTLRVGKLYLKDFDFDQWLLCGVNRLIKKIRPDDILCNNILRHKIEVIAQCYFDLYLSYGFNVNKLSNHQQASVQENLPSIAIYDSKYLDMPALHYACKLATPLWVKTLLIAGADRQLTNNQDKLPIDFCREHYKQYNVVNMKITVDLLTHYTSCPRRTKEGIIVQ
ncbi:hypothetical protein TrispH2_007059 [Trichoplax sp. H2]|nr:hypothetical protein TrispH2_007059 [Trichoplax sp. H2]|eukprot:RDD41380.1 hypothetical protein TrispH2_007059 [Trichoplax sp. H2]